MKLTKNINSITLHFHSLSIGNTFEYNGLLYLKTSFSTKEIYNAVCFNDAQECKFGGDEKVIRIKIDEIIYHEQ